MNIPRVKRTAGIGPMMAKIQKHFDDVVHGRVEHRREWLTPVWG